MNLELVTHTARAAMAQELGKKADSQKTLLEHELLRTQGAIGALTQLLSKQEALQNMPAQEGAEPMQAQKDVWDEAICAAFFAATELRAEAKQNSIALTGQIAACERSLDVCQAAFEAEIRNLRLAEAAIEADIQAAASNKPAAAPKKAQRKAGEHPGPSLKKARNSRKI